MRSIPRITWQILLPSFLHPSSTTPSNGHPKNTIVALDGLRGVACLIVFNEHITYNLTSSWLHEFQHFNISSLNRLPILRLPWTGWSMVNIFFVISGYVLSYKPLRQTILEDNPTAASRTIFYSALKRAPHLYLPTFIALLLVALLSHLHVFDPARNNFLLDNNKYSLHEISPPIFPAFYDQAIDAYTHCGNMLSILNWSVDISSGDYDRHTWTIPVEMRTSILLFLTLWGTLKLNTHRRAIAFAVLALVASFSERFEVVCFFAGALLAQWEVERKVDLGEKWTTSTTPVPWRVGFGAFVVGLFLISVPIGGANLDPFYRHLVMLLPAQSRDSGGYVRAIGSVVVTWAVLNWEPATRVFSSGLAAYLGKVSFALYLVHGSVVRGVFHVVLPMYYGWVGESRSWEVMVGGWVLGVVTCLPLAIWVSDLFCRWVDVPVVRLCRWMEVRAGAMFSRSTGKLELGMGMGKVPRGTLGHLFRNGVV